MPSPRLAVALVLAAAGTTAAAGCGSNDSSAKSPSATARTPQTTTTQTTPAASAAPSAGPVDVTLTEWAVKPSTTTVKAGRVTFNVTNDGKAEHEFVVLRTSKKADTLASSNASRVSEKGNVGEVGDLKPDGSGKVTIKLKPGHYALVCNIDGHWMAGMRTDLTVQ